MINIRQCVRTNGMHPNGSRNLFNVAYELMCVIINFTCSDNRMNYLKGNTFHQSRDLGDLNLCFFNFTFSVNH